MGKRTATPPSIEAGDAAISRRNIFALLERAFSDGLQWLSSELRVSKNDAVAIAKNWLWGVVLIIASFAMFLAGLIVLAETLVDQVGRYLDSPLAGSLLAGCSILFVAAILAWGASRKMKLVPPRSRILKWIISDRAKSGGGAYD